MGIANAQTVTANHSVFNDVNGSQINIQVFVNDHGTCTPPLVVGDISTDYRRPWHRDPPRRFVNCTHPIHEHCYIDGCINHELHGHAHCVPHEPKQDDFYIPRFRRYTPFSRRTPPPAPTLSPLASRGTPPAPSITPATSRRTPSPTPAPSVTPPVSHSPPVADYSSRIKQLVNELIHLLEHHLSGSNLTTTNGTTEGLFGAKGEGHKYEGLKKEGTTDDIAIDVEFGRPVCSKKGGTRMPGSCSNQAWIPLVF